MRFALLALLVCLGCGKSKSKLDLDRGADVDALWDLAPDGTELGIVVSPRAVGLGFRAIAAVRELSNQPDLAPMKPQIDALAKGLFGSETGTPEDAGFAKDRAFAMFATTGGVLGIMPVADRDKFLAAKRGERGSAEDKLEQNTCRMIGSNYVCATKIEMFDRLGKGKLRGKVAAVIGPSSGQLRGARGDAELYMMNIALLGDARGELAVTAQLEPGQLSVHGRWTGQPDGVLAKVAGIAAPKPETTGASGFAAVNIAPLVDSLPAIPIAADVTFDQLAKSLAGPISAVIPAGSVDIQVFAPLKEPKSAQTVIANCADVGRFFELADKQTEGACRLRMQGTNNLELDAWVDGNQLRLGANKGPMPAGKPGAMTAVGRELASGNWTAAFWGRGTMLNLTGIAPAQDALPAEVALGVHAMALVNELGAAARVDTDGLRFRAFIRTAWANPPGVIDKVVAISGNDIVTGKATDAAQAIAASSPSSPFAADFDAGQGGLMVPAAMIGLVSAVVMPAVMRMVGGEDDAAAVDEPMKPEDLMQLLMRAYVEEAYPKWRAEHPNKRCPATLDEVAKHFGDNPGLPVTTDAWGQPLVMKCDDKDGFRVLSLGADGKEGTDDDVRSW